MPIQHAIWKVGAPPEALAVSKLATEKDLEDMITARPEMISSGWMLIGRQVRTSFGGIIDLLAIAPDGSLVLIELKRDKTPREIVAQASGFVRVEWLDTVPAAQAIWEVGFFANQNSVGRPRAEEW
jgi:RecB family endonuclease NucS